MSNQFLSLIFGTVLLVILSSAGAQQPKKVPVIGYLDTTFPASASVRLNAFRQGLRTLGYEEGKNLSIEYRFAEGKTERLKALAADLVRLSVDVIVTGGPTGTRGAREATTKIPVVMTWDSDPVGNGFVASLARPGGNITGLSTLSLELNGKRLEILKEVVPALSRVAILRTSTSPSAAHEVRETEITAQALGLKRQLFDILRPKDMAPSLEQLHKNRDDAIVVLSSTVLIAHRRELVGLVAKHRVPAIYYRREFVEDGGLMSYAPDLLDLSRRAATYVDKILKGVNPANLPVEQPKKFELVINLKTAQQIGLTIPPSLLYRADKVIR